MSATSNYSLKYHDYAAVFCTLSDEQGIRTVGNPNRQLPHVELEAAVDRYRDDVLQHEIDEYFRANGVPVPRPLAPHLYRPRHYLAFGYADYISWLLIDEFDCYFHLTTTLDLPVNQITLGFCPRLDSLAIPTASHGDVENSAWLLEFVAERCNERPTDVPITPFVELHELSGAAAENKRSDRPLVVFSRLKLSPLAVLGSGVLLRRAVFRAMAARVHEAQWKLALARESGVRRDRELLDKLEIDTASVNALQVGFMHAQGPEELGLYFRCTNYSVAISALTAICGLTLGDLLDPRIGGAGLRDVVTDAGTHQTLMGNRRYAGRATLDDNHVFVSTYSIAAITPELALTPETTDLIPKSVKGVMEVHGRANLTAGHLHDAEHTLRNCLGAPLSPVELDWDQIHRFLVGRYDYDFSLTWESNQRLKLIHCRDFLQVASSIRETFGRSNQTLDETGLLDFSSGLVIPIPVLDARHRIAAEVPANHFPLIPSLERLVAELFDRPDGLLSSPELNRALTRLRLPRRLERIVRHALKCFRDSLLDPLLFDSTLELFDALRSLQHLLTRDLPRQLDLLDDLDYEQHDAVMFRELLFRESMIDAIRQFVDAIQNAHSHRIRRESRVELHDWAIDFRGGLTQMVLGAAAPMWCGVELLRWCWRTQFASKGTGRTARETLRERPVGVLTRLTFYRSHRFHRIEASDDQRAAMGIFDFSVGHIFVPTEFAEYLHAAAVMILTAWDEEEPALIEGIDELTGDRTVSAINEEDRQLRAELFAELIVQFFVYGSDWELARRQTFVAWNAHPVASGAELAQSFVRKAMKSFLATSLFRSFKKYTDDPSAPAWPFHHPWCQEARRKLGRSAQLDSPLNYAAFRAYLDEVGPLCCYYDFVREVYLGDDKLRRRYHSLYQKWIWLFDDVWWRAVRVYRRFTRTRPMWRSAGKMQRAALRTAMAQCLDTGEASIWHELLAENIVAGLPTADATDDLCLLVHLLSAYAEAELKRVDPDGLRIHRIRDAGGTSDYRVAGDPRRWSSYQLDRRMPRPFCSDPTQRVQRMQRDIVLHQILGDLSSRLRARQLREIFSTDRRAPRKVQRGELVQFEWTDHPAELEQLGFPTDIETDDSGEPPRRPR